jgi:hypothetical protein
LLELPNKINLPERQYFIVQQAYRGCNQLAYLLVIESHALGAAFQVLARGLSSLRRWHERIHKPNDLCRTSPCQQNARKRKNPIGTEAPIGHEDIGGMLPVTLHVHC